MFLRHRILGSENTNWMPSSQRFAPTLDQAASKTKNKQAADDLEKELGL